MKQAILAFLARAYGSAIAGRTAIYSSGLLRTIHLPVPVVSIGNISVGGTGKSPLASHLARILLEKELHPLLLSRGHGRKQNNAVYLPAGDLPLSAEIMGDEPFMLKMQNPGISLLVHKDRGSIAKKIWQKLDCDIVLLDDAFQYWALSRNLDLVTIDLTQDIFQNLLPAGNFREPISALCRANAIIFTRANEVSLDAAKAKIFELQKFLQANCNSLAPIKPWKKSAQLRDRTIYITEYAPQSILLTNGKIVPPERWKNTKAILISGIANPESFAKTVESMGIEVLDSLKFPDHHWLRAKDMENIERTMKKLISQQPLLLCTEKDYIRWIELKAKFPASFGCVRIAIKFSQNFAEIAGLGTEEKLLDSLMRLVQ